MELVCENKQHGDTVPEKARDMFLCSLQINKKKARQMRFSTAGYVCSTQTRVMPEETRRDARVRNLCARVSLVRDLLRIYTQVIASFRLPQKEGIRRQSFLSTFVIPYGPSGTNRALKNKQCKELKKQLRRYFVF